MKVKTSEAARQLGLHPSHLFQHIVEVSPDLAFDDVWPEVDIDWIHFVSSTHPPVPPESEQPPDQSSDVTASLSDNAVRVLDKLVRQRKWGSASVPFEALRNIAHLSNHDLDNVVAELRKGGLLDHDGTGRGTISLNSAQRSEIESAVESRRAVAARA